MTSAWAQHAAKPLEDLEIRRSVTSVLLLDGERSKTLGFKNGSSLLAARMLCFKLISNSCLLKAGLGQFASLTSLRYLHVAVVGYRLTSVLQQPCSC